MTNKTDLKSCGYDKHFDYEYWYKRVYNSSQVGIFRSELTSGKVIDCNDKLATILGFSSKQECINNYVASEHYVDSYSRQNLISELRQHGSVDNYHVFLTNKIGKIVYFNLTAHLNKEMRCIDGIVQDITPQKELQMFQNVVNILSQVNIDTGQTYFIELIQILAKEIGATCVCIGELSKSKDKVSTVAITVKGKIIDNYTYALAGTPCEDVVTKTGCYFPEKVQEKFPRDTELKVLSAQCYAGIPILSKNRIVKGILFVVGDKPFQFDYIILTLLSIFAEKAYLEMERLDKYHNKLKAWKQTVKAFTSALDMRDPYTSEHQIRTASLAVKIAKDLNLDKDTIEGLELAAIVHDAGKMCIPIEFLTKPRKLASCEWDVIKNHSFLGYEIFKNIDFPWPIAEIVYQHHERLDGSGYPRGLKGNEILLESKIIAVADVVDAMCTDRPYRLAPGLKAAIKEVTEFKGIKYDNKVVDALLNVIKSGFKFS